MLAADLDRERLRLQAIAVAGLAGVGGLVAREFFADPVAVGFLPAALDVADDAFEGFVGLVVARAVPVRELDFLVAGAVQDGELHVLGQLAPTASSSKPCSAWRGFRASARNRARSRRFWPRARRRLLQRE